MTIDDKLHHYSRDEVVAAINAGADLVLENISMDHDEEYGNAANVIVCAILSTLNNPDISFISMMQENFDTNIDQWLSEFPVLEQYVEEE